MGNLRIILAAAVLPLLSINSVLAQSPAVAGASTKYCSTGDQSICYSEYSAPAPGVLYRIAIPDVAQAPFDVLLQLVAPLKVGWAGIGWAGSLEGSPLTVVWPSGNTVVTSSRLANGDDLSAPFPSASYTVLASSRNASHWTADLLCAGCSSWDGASLNPSGVNNLLWAVGNNAPVNAGGTVPAATASGTFAEDLATARVSSNKFRRYILSLQDGQQAGGGGGAEEPAPPAATSAAGPTALQPTATTVIRPPSPGTTSGGQAPTSVQTSVTVLPPRPSTTGGISSFSPTVIGPRPTTRTSTWTSVTTITVRTSVTTVTGPRTTLATSTRPGVPPVVTVTVTVTRGPTGPSRTTRTVPSRPTSTRCIGWWCDEDEDEDDDPWGGGWGQAAGAGGTEQQA